MVAVNLAQDARPVAARLHRLDLDDVRALLRQQHAAIGAGDALAEVDHLQPRERCLVAHRRPLPAGQSCWCAGTVRRKNRAAFSPRIFARCASFSIGMVRSIASAECGQVPSWCG